MLRQVVPELLDELPPTDPRAIHSRGDLRRINRLMGNADIMARAITTGALVARGAKTAPLAPRFVELGGGDGTFLLALARRVAPMVGPAHVTLVDQQSLITPATTQALAALSWNVDTVKADVFDWLSRRNGDGSGGADLTIANLFLHHFDGARLERLLRGAAHQTRVFLACEPLRSGAALAAASMMRLIGCNKVTLHDGKISVRAGFRDSELSAAWPDEAGWILHEHRAGRFTHAFMARREDPRV
jgi:hypothetical protein